MDLAFLPPKLVLNGTFEEATALLYSIFERDIKHRPLRYNNLFVVFDDRKIDSEYEEGFWHIITRGSGGDRLMDYKRAKRITWLRPLIENADEPQLHKWVDNEMDKRGRYVEKTYIWYREGNYLIVLKEIPRKYFLSTAFYVTGDRNDRFYLERFERAKKKGPGC